MLSCVASTSFAAKVRLVSFIPSTSSVPFRKKERGQSRPAGRSQWMAGRKKKRRKNGQHQPLGVNWSDCTWCSETPCWCAWLPFLSFLNSTWQRKTLTPSMIGSMDQSWGAVGLPLRSRRCSWRSAMHGERFMSWCMVACILRKLSTRSKTTVCSGWEKSMKESSPNKQKGNPRKARTRRAHGGPPSANLNGRRKERAKETKEERGKESPSLNLQIGHHIGLSRTRRGPPSAVITSSRRLAKVSVDAPTIVQLWMLRDGFVMQDPKNTSQRIALTRLERIQRLPVALWGILKAQGETGTTRRMVVQGPQTWQPPRLVVMTKRLGVPQVFHGLRVHRLPILTWERLPMALWPQRRPYCLPVGEVSKALQLDGAWPWSRHFLPKPNVQWFGTQWRLLLAEICSK